MPAAAPIELIVHIGDGKTGTSAIQRMLRSHPDSLARARTRYLGLMLEHGFGKRHAWQDPARIEAFHALPDAQAVSELQQALAETLDGARAAGLTRLIWSNESLFHRGASTIAALAQLDEGVRIRVVVYVRRHDAWARSAFLQWGLKHKTYEGPVRDFAAWKANRRFHLMPRLSPWESAFGPVLSIRNFDVLDDVALDFCRIAGLDPVQFTTDRRNQTPSNGELALRALFNDAIAERALPSRFDQTMDADTIDFDRGMQTWLQAKLPSPEALAGIVEDCASDRAQVNALLGASGQSGLDDTALDPGAARLDPDKLICALYQIVVGQALRLDRLEQQLRAPAPLPTPAPALSTPALADPIPPGVAETLAPGRGYFGVQRSDCLQLALSGPVVGLRLELSRGPEFLNLRGIECLVADEVVPLDALGAHATQSSIAREDPGYGPEHLLQMKGIHTAADERPWWEVRFDDAHHFDTVRIYNRGDGWSRRARALRVLALRPDGSAECMYDGYGDARVRAAFGAACQAAEMTQPSHWPTDATAAGQQRAALLAPIAARVAAGGLALDAVDWRALAPLLPLWGTSEPTDADWTLVAAMLLAQQRSRLGTGLATLSGLLDRRSRLLRLEAEINRLATPLRIGPFMLTRHGLRRQGMLRLDPDRYQRHLAAVIATLETLGGEPMLAYGTLLGAVREGAFLTHDDDVDILYVARGASRDEVVAEDLPRVAAALEAQGFRIHLLLPHNLNMHVVDPATGAVVDVFPCWRENGGMRLHMEAMQLRALEVGVFLPRSTVVLGDAKLPAPARPDAFLEARYGEDWRVADPYFEWPWTLQQEAGS